MLKRLLLAFWVSLICVFGGCRAIGPQIETGVKSYVDECRDYPELCSSLDSEDSAATDSEENADGSGGDSTGMPTLSLPFPIGEYWQITQTYNPSNDSSSTHKDYGGTYSDDRWAVDFAQGSCKDYGKPVNPMAEGTVYYVETDDGSGTGYGNTVIVRHSNSFYSRYAHFSEILVSVGDHVDTGDYIGKVGNTGNVSGTSCSEHPGTHLHLAVYKDGEGVMPEPLSGNSGLTVGCWYDRLGDVSCSGDPGDTEPEPEEDELDISYLAVNPENGTAGETEFVWTAVVNSPDIQPDSTLVIHNPNDGVNYEFEMETESAENPWIFSYQKTLRDAATYTYWVKASNDEGNTVSDAEEVQVDEAVDTSLNVNSISWTPLSGTSGETEFTWSVSVTSSTKPSVDLYILNPNDATTYDFAMSVSGGGSSWTATYSKTLRDATTYAFWAVADNGVTTSVSSIGSLTVSDPVVEGSGGGEEEDTSPIEDTEVVTTDTGSGESHDTGTVVVDTGSTDSVSTNSDSASSDSESAVVEDSSADSPVSDSVHEDSPAEVVDSSPPEDTEVVDTAILDSGSAEETGSVDSSSEYEGCDEIVPTDYATIQEAIDIAGYNDVICVASGTYYENLSIKGMNLTLVSLSGAGSTIIDGGGKSNVISITDGSTATVEGFTIQDGNYWPGGGFYIIGANPIIKHCVVTGNLPYGISISDSASPTIENTLMVANIYRGLYVTNYSSPQIINSVIAGNLHDGVGIFTDSNVSLTNSIVYGNGDYGIAYNSSTASANTSYVDVYGNAKGEYYGGASAGGTDYSSDPSFVDPVRYELSSGSSCIDAGDSSSSFNDVDGSRNDLGAYGGPFGSW